MQLTSEVLEKIQKITVQNYPHEMCGFVSKDNNFYELANISSEPTLKCAFDLDDIIHNKKNIRYIVHSHTQPRTDHIQTPSAEDIIWQLKLDIPFLISAYDGNRYYQPVQLPHVPNNNYIGREHIFAIQDCYNLVQDFYKFEFGINILSNELQRATHKEELADIIPKELEFNGFKQQVNWNANTLKYGDILLSTTIGITKNHVMLYIDSETILHQFKVSEYASMRNWYNRIATVWRHESKYV